MAFITELHERLDALAARGVLDVDAVKLPAVVRKLGDADLLSVLTEAIALATSVERLVSVAAGVTDERSARDRGHGGLAASRGHRSPASLIQSISGGTKADVDRQLRVGRGLLESQPVEDAATAEVPVVASLVWHAPVARAVMSGRITGAQQQAIVRGLGDPPVRDGRAAAAFVEAWSLATEQLIDEAGEMPVEELARRARQVRDALDPAGCEERFLQRYEARSFRTWTDRDGAHHAHIDFDDEMAAWVRAVCDAALRPRRGGPRFVDPDEKTAADDLIADARTNDQLAYDLMMQCWRSGAVADVRDVFGARQPGVRVVTVLAAGIQESDRAFGTIGHVEDGGDALPTGVVESAVCNSGIVDVTVDSCGNPLDVGREQRLYTPKQRIALAIRDGGCRHPGCTVPASYCEAHHCDHWWEHRGRTDIDRGILLCRFHHMALHHSGAHITRDRHGPFILHSADGAEVVLRSKAPWEWAWDPPPPLERPGWRAA